MNIGREIVRGLEQFLDDLKNDRPITVTKVVLTGTKVRRIKGKTGTNNKPCEIISISEHDYNR